MGIFDWLFPKKEDQKESDQKSPQKKRKDI